jgi:hypothetical protein
VAVTVLKHPPVGLQLSVVQALPSSQFFGVCTHFWATGSQVSIVQAFPSLHSIQHHQSQGPNKSPTAWC